MRCVVHYYEQAKRVIVESQGEQKVTWSVVLNQTKQHFVNLSQMKFQVILYGEYFMLNI